MEIILSFGWLALMLVACPLAWWGGYLSSIRRDSRKRQLGYVLCALALTCLVLSGVLSPGAPNGFGFAIAVAWMVAYLALALVALAGRDYRRRRSKFSGWIVR